MVGHCPSCGNPIYGTRHVDIAKLGAEVVEPRRSCICPPLHVIAGVPGRVPDYPPRWHHGDGDEPLAS